MTSKISLILILALMLGCSGRTYEDVRGKHLRLTNGDKQVLWFSGIHTNDPECLIFADLKQEIEIFAPSLIVLEGGFHAAKYESDHDARLHGECAYTSWTAQRMGIPMASTEPTDEEINRQVLQTHDAAELLATYLFRQMVQLQREAENREHGYEELVSEVFTSSLVAGIPESVLQELDPHALVDACVGYHVDDTNWQDVDAASLIYGKHGKLCSVYQAIYNSRNRHLLHVLQDALPLHDRIFIMMGFDHAEELSTELQILLSQP